MIVELVLKITNGIQDCNLNMRGLEEKLFECVANRYIYDIL